MYLVYIDESGSHDDGSFTQGQKVWQPNNSRESSIFVLTGLVVHQNDWKSLFKKLKGIRENVRQTHGIPLNEYIHATELVTGNGIWRHDTRKSFTRSKRINLLKNLLHEYAQLGKYCYYGSSIAKKTAGFCNPHTCRELSYENLLNRLEKDLKDEYVIIHDGHEDGAVIRLLRKKRVFNFVQGKKFILQKLIEDPLFKRANISYFLQAVDHISYVLLHLYDTKLPNSDVAKLYANARLAQLGNARMCCRTRPNFPGHIPIP
ncbi:MAG: DUF3800 domain-containing protein [Candidatus Peribacteraceae bacterium]|nr:DUF3800 domain-containing protein [Candidatus Peribacteraceae bacterium]MDD5743084.1 DUF3800 domain-containing protein [Candidatus Peribacteraceae bacterium]